jgi:hypothetical protein
MMTNSFAGIWAAWKWVIILALLLLLSMVVNGFLFWQWAQAKPECKAATSGATLKANEGLRASEATRDTKLDKVTADVRADTQQKTNATQDKTHAREAIIQTVVVRGDCVAPVGLPPLDAAVGEANAATGQ